MSERNHTKGDWHENKERELEIECDGKAIATCWKYATGEIAARANRTLMANSPKLLESLEELVALIHRQKDFNDDGDGMAIARAEAVIAKATGGA